MIKFEEENPGQHMRAECIAIADLAVTCTIDAVSIDYSSSAVSVFKKKEKRKKRMLL